MNDEYVTLLHTLDQALLAVMILVIMFGMGAGLTVNDFRAVARRWRLVAIGFASQFGLMPLLAFSLAIALQLPPAYAIALILVGTLPGGSTSNMFTYFARGSVALSISMTTASTLAALLMMPILLQLYTPYFAVQLASYDADGTMHEFVIPVANIIVSLVLVLVPVIGGMTLRRFSRGWAKAAEDTAGFMAMIVIIFLITSTLIRHFGLLIETSPRVYLAAITVGLSGFFFGFLVSRLFGAFPIHQRAIALETGIQNGPIAFAIILLSFPPSAMQNDMLWLAILYSLFIVITSSFFTLWLRKRGKLDWEITKNTLVHRRLFGSNYATNYPDGFVPLRLRSDPTQGGLEAADWERKRDLERNK